MKFRSLSIAKKLIVLLNNRSTYITKVLRDSAKTIKHNVEHGQNLEDDFFSSLKYRKLTQTTPEIFLLAS